MTEEHQRTTSVEHTSLVSLLISRHTRKVDCQLRIGALNIRSVNNNVDDVLEVMLTYYLHILALSETWHENSESVMIKCMRRLGFKVLEVAMLIPEDIDDNINFVNHEGLAIVTKPGIIIAKLNMKLNAMTLEFLCCHITVDGASFILVDIYRPGSVPPSSALFNEFTGLLEILATFQLPVTITGDLNIHLQKQDDVGAVTLVNVLSSFNLLKHVSSPTHDSAGLFDVIIASGDHPPEDVSVDEFRLSDHMILS